MAIAKSDFTYLQQLVLRDSAIVLEEGKDYLLESRLGPLARREGLAGLAELVSTLRTEVGGVLRAKVVDAMTTNETTFFRDVHPFESLRTELIPRLVELRSDRRQIEILCAACSSGQEPYTIAMLLCEHFPRIVNDWRIRITALDLSDTMLERARGGLYSQLEVNRGLPVTYLVKYFTKEGSSWRLKDNVRKLVTFQQANLAAPSWPLLPPQDLVFIRNVLIYFDVKTKKQILGQVRKVLRPDGHMFLGAAETTLSLDEAFERVSFGKGSCYRLRALEGSEPCSRKMKFAG